MISNNLSNNNFDSNSKNSGEQELKRQKVNEFSIIKSDKNPYNIKSEYKENFEILSERKQNSKKILHSSSKSIKSNKKYQSEDIEENNEYPYKKHFISRKKGKISSSRPKEKDKIIPNDNFKLSGISIKSSNKSENKNMIIKPTQSKPDSKNEEPKKISTIKSQVEDMIQKIQNSNSNELIANIEENYKCCCQTSVCIHIAKPEIDDDPLKRYLVVIDDNLYIRKTVCNLLSITFGKIKEEKKTKYKFEIIEGSDGIDALKFIIDRGIASKIKAIFIDENMEYLNGSESVRIIRNLQKLNKVGKFSIASVTAFEDQAMKQIIKTSGMDEVYSKPLSKSQLLDFLDKYKILI